MHKETQILKSILIVLKTYLLQGFSYPGKVEKIYNLKNLSTSLYKSFSLAKLVYICGTAVPKPNHSDFGNI